jgi:hypothetical protein
VEEWPILFRKMLKEVDFFSPRYNYGDVCNVFMCAFKDFSLQETFELELYSKGWINP